MISHSPGFCPLEISTGIFLDISGWNLPRIFFGFGFLAIFLEFLEELERASFEEF